MADHSIPVLPRWCFTTLYSYIIPSALDVTFFLFVCDYYAVWFRWDSHHLSGKELLSYFCLLMGFGALISLPFHVGADGYLIKIVHGIVFITLQNDKKGTDRI